MKKLTNNNFRFFIMKKNIFTKIYLENFFNNNFFEKALIFFFTKNIFQKKYTHLFFYDLKKKKLIMFFEERIYLFLEKSKFGIFIENFKKKFKKKKNVGADMLRITSHNLFKDNNQIIKKKKNKFLKIIKKDRENSFLDEVYALKLQIVKKINKKSFNNFTNFPKYMIKMENNRRNIKIRFLNKARYHKFSSRFHGTKPKRQKNEKKIIDKNNII
ncbi:hypothetical protein CMESO_416 (nucleomorph) [Chroomonas mesostigmatica CCMP1168]|uniref:Uncharacterized protein n=1 Tax=Chroomonas mesostigmatica CCMP1168 TaxID=1195612 RepID=J7G3E2_9CRYP|nr:hypothetical protein CMESO_416 [Chroomonas mesostigmatica CCMP1168]